MRRIASGLVVLACYGALVAFLTWPLARHAATHLPKTTHACEFDTLYSGWALAHESTALFSDPARLSQGNNFHPAADTIFHGPTGYGALPYFAPVFLWSGNPTVALNFLLYASIALTAWTLHLTVRHWTASHLAGIVAACTFLFTRWTLWRWLPTTPHAAVLQYFPLIILLAATPTTKLGPNLALLALVVLQCLTDVVYVAPAVLAPLAVLAAVRLARRPTRAAGAALLAVVAIGGLATFGAAAGHLRVGAANPNLAAQGFWKIDPDQWRRNGTAIPWGLFDSLAPTALPAMAFGLLGAFVFSRRARQQPQWNALVLWAAVGTFLSLTPTVRVGGHPIDLPQAFLARWIPLLGQIRVPSRLGVSALMSLAILTGLAFAELARRIAEERPLDAKRWIASFAALVVLAMYVEYRTSVGSTSGYPLAPAPTDAPFAAELREAGGPLLELPAGLEGTRAPARHARAMYRSIFHRHDVLNGYASYWPSGFAERMALAERLPDPDALAELRRETGVAFVWVHGRDLPESRAAWNAVEREGRDDLTLVARDGEELLFAVKR